MDRDEPNALPAQFLERLPHLVPEDRLADVLASFACEKPPTFRVNTLRADDETVLAELADAGVRACLAEGLDHVYRAQIEDRETLVRSDAFTGGRIYVQNVSSLLAGFALDVEPGMAVLDLAAAPGGKTLHLACLMNDTGTLSAVEPTRGRFFRLKNNLEVHGVHCARTYLKDGRAVGRLCPERFDRVLLDAPCSGEAMLRADGTSSLENWSPAKIRRCAGKQGALLAAAVDACRTGGAIVYCTCSMAPEENEAVVADALDRFTGTLTVETVPLPACAEHAAIPGLTSWRNRIFPDAVHHACRILPDDWFGAFFLCRLRKG